MFVSGSHDLKTCDLLMNGGPRGEEELMRRLVRPHLAAGDALLFDCRVLHFGTANNYSPEPQKLAVGSTGAVGLGAAEGERGLCDGARPMLYVNYHRTWFNDPKNWNNRERLFPASAIATPTETVI